MVNVNELREIDVQFDRSNWLTEELESTLDLLPTQKHRTTVLRLVEGKVIGRTEDDTFKMKDVCAKKTWHGPYRDGVRHQGWKDDKTIQKAMKLAEECLAGHQETAILANIQEAERLLAETAVQAVMCLSVLIDTADNDETRRRAANDILDRVSKTFARKTTSITEQRSISFDLTQMPQNVMAALAGLPVGPEPFPGEVIDHTDPDDTAS